MPEREHQHEDGFGGEVLNLYKQMGETPRERLERLRVQKPYYQGEVLSYAGRLDPMAEGVLLCLVGSANKRRERYLDMSKEYTLDVLFGFSTDTYDVLGRVMDTGEVTKIAPKDIKKALNEFRGTVRQEYPPFSSKVVEGKPLFEWARGNVLSAIVLPQRTVTVYDIVLENVYKLSESELFNYIEENVEKVQGDFRQEEVMRLWRRRLRKTPPTDSEREFPCATIKISCSSGTYARSIANGLGSELGVPALALHILRTKVGEYDIADSLK
jgi:tRNA pseudouridine55 synthase